MRRLRSMHITFCQVYITLEDINLPLSGTLSGTRLLSRAGLSRTYTIIRRLRQVHVTVCQVYITWEEVKLMLSGTLSGTLPTLEDIKPMLLGALSGTRPTSRAESSRTHIWAFPLDYITCLSRVSIPHSPLSNYLDQYYHIDPLESGHIQILSRSSVDHIDVLNENTAKALVCKLRTAVLQGLASGPLIILNL